MWRKALRTVWNLPNRTHCSIVACLTKNSCDYHTFISRAVQFTRKCFSHENNTVKFVLMKALQCEKSVFHRNLNMCLSSMNINFEDFLCIPQNEIHIKMREQCRTKCKTRISTCISEVVCELCDIRDDIDNCVLSPSEAEELIYQICTD